MCQYNIDWNFQLIPIVYVRSPHVAIEENFHIDTCYTVCGCVFVSSVKFVCGKKHFRNSTGLGNCRANGSWHICSGYDMRVFYDCSKLRNISQTSEQVLSYECVVKPTRA